VESAELPLSIIIVGVGNEKFDKMKSLDGKSEVLRDVNGKAVVRDIVQFVRIKDYAMKGIDALTAEVLKEIPKQFVQHIMTMALGSTTHTSLLQESSCVFSDFKMFN